MAQTIYEMRKEWGDNDAKRDAGLTVPKGIALCKDIVYRKDPDMLTDVYFPANCEGVIPTIISIHGGGWFYGDKELYSHYCMRLAKRGFAVVNFNYRLAPENQYPAALEDCTAILHWVKEQGGEYHIDKDRLFVVGDSAGGQLAFQLLTMLTSPAYARLFGFSCPQDIKVLGCGLNCGCYFLPFNRLLPPKVLGALYTAYFPKDYMAILPQLKPEKYVTDAFPPAYVMSAHHDFLKFMAPRMHRLLNKKGVANILKIYGCKQEKDIAHVFHLNCRLHLADVCNDDECAFFREQL